MTRPGCEAADLEVAALPTVIAGELFRPSHSQR
jgi:hypothetical protein